MRKPAGSVDHTLLLFEKALGDASVHRLVRGGHCIGAVGRWRHDGARIDLGQVATTQLLFNVTGGQSLHWQRGERGIDAVARCGTVVAIGAEDDALLTITGSADTVQFLLDRAIAPPTLSAQSQARLQALAAVALTALAERDEARLDDISRGLFDLLDADAADAPGTATGGVAPAALAQIGALVTRRLAEKPEDLPTIAELAALAGLSHFHFVRQFARSMGLTPHAWIDKQRMERALVLLLQYRLSVAEVADGVGYASSAEFVAAFHRRMGVTPARLREAAR